MHNLHFPSNDCVLVGKGTADDAGVYLVNEELALIQTVDFFTPVVDDPYDFGRIAAANSLSDVYAMGGVPQTAMNIVAYPVNTLPLDALKEILAGGAAILREAGAVLLGGHSVEDEELKYGLSVTGFAHPRKIWRNQGLQQESCLILTKPIGTGIVNTAIKGGLASVSEIEQVTSSMTMLNKAAAEVLADFPIDACTDITGFGLLGHLAEMLAGTGTGAQLELAAIPVLSGALSYAAMGLVPAGAYRNRIYRQEMVVVPEGLDPALRDVLFDPQTSGGLLFGCSQEDAPSIVNRLHNTGVGDAAVIGTITSADEKIYLV